MRLCRGDCRKFMFDGTISSESVDLTVTSPPYDNLRTYNNSSTWGWAEFCGVVSGLWRVTKPGGVVVWVVNDATIKGSETGTSFKQALAFKDCGFNLHDTMIYQRRAAPLTHKRYEQGFEYMFIFVKRKIAVFNGIQVKRKWPDNRTVKRIRKERDGSIDFGYAKQSETVLKDNVWHIHAGGGHCTKDRFAHKHPAIFPEKLAHDHIISWSNKGDIVFDPFMGSGTTGKMALENERDFIGCEIDKEYFEIAKKRIMGVL